MIELWRRPKPLLWRVEAIRLKRHHDWLRRGVPLALGVAAASWLIPQHSTALALLVGAASLAVFGWEFGGSSDEHKHFKFQPDLSAAFGTLCAELHVSGILYACDDDEQGLRPVARTMPEPASPLRWGDDPATRAMTTLKPYFFTTYTAPEALAQQGFAGCSTLVYPMIHKGRAVGMALLTSRQVELGQAQLERVQSAEPLLSLLLENEVLNTRLSRSQSEKEAIIALTRLAQGRSDSDQVFQEAALQLRRLTGACHAAIALRTPMGALVVGGLSTEGGARVREGLMAAELAEREWPHFHQVLSNPVGSTLVPLSTTSLTPAESAWARHVAPNGHMLCAAFGPEEARDGVLVLCWPQEGALRLQESRLAQRLGDLMALVAASRRQGATLRAVEAREAASARLSATQEGLIAQMVREVRKATFAVRQWRQEFSSGAMPSGEVLQALDQQASVLSHWLATAADEEAERSSLRTGLQEAHAVAREFCRRKGQSLEVEALPEAELSLSPLDFGQIVGTLLDNASRYSPPGTSIRSWAAVSEAWATVYVSDQGEGIPPELQDRVGQAGFQVEPSRGGQGMGLAQARELVDRAGGVLGFTSEVGKGSTFYVTLPIGRRGPERDN